MSTAWCKMSLLTVIYTESMPEQTEVVALSLIFCTSLNICSTNLTLLLKILEKRREFSGFSDDEQWSSELRCRGDDGDFFQFIHFACLQLCRPFSRLSYCFLPWIPQSSSILKKTHQKKKIIAAFVGCGFEISHINGCHLRSLVAVRFE